MRACRVLVFAGRSDRRLCLQYAELLKEWREPVMLSSVGFAAFTAPPAPGLHLAYTDMLVAAHVSSRLCHSLLIRSFQAQLNRRGVRFELLYSLLPGSLRARLACRFLRSFLTSCSLFLPEPITSSLVTFVACC
jgi:hypothetical protein